MATNGIDSWAVDLKDVGAIYPFQGSEGILVLIGVATWIGWHVWCARWEREYHEKKIAKYGSSEDIKKALDEH